MAVVINGTTGIDKVQDGSIGTADIAADAITTPKIASSVNLGRRNLIINGDFQINQRGNGSGVGNAGYIGVDRWRGYISTSSTVTFTQTAFAHGQSDVDKDLRHYLRFDWLGTGAATSKLLSQHIENVQKGNGQKVTVSFWGRTEQADDCVLQIHQHFGTGGSAGVDHISPTIDLTTSWQYFTHTFDLTSTSGKTIGANNSLRFEFLFGPATLNSYFEVTGVQVEVGDTATPFEHLSFGEQQTLCQRYCQVWSEGGDALIFAGKGQGTTAIDFGWPLAVPLRASPTLSQTGTGWRAFRPSSNLVHSAALPTIVRFGETHPFICLRVSSFPSSSFSNNYAVNIGPQALSQFIFDSEL